jgi:hypothetical protein
LNSLFLLPYLIWMIIATSLNAYIFIKNWLYLRLLNHSVFLNCEKICFITTANHSRHICSGTES